MRQKPMSYRTFAVLAVSTATAAIAREITFPPIAGIQRPLANGGVNILGQIISTDDPFTQDPLDLSSAIYAGLTTYANLPYVHCLAKEGIEVDKYDIAILGAPFDTGVTARPGARFGPRGIRQGSRRIGWENHYSVHTGENPFLKGLKIVDCGDAPLTFLDNTVALAQLDKAHKVNPKTLRAWYDLSGVDCEQVVSGRKANASEYGSPRIITLGGDHTTTLSALRSTFDHWGAVSVIHFDSHIDTWDADLLGGGLSHYAGVNHGTFLHIAHEEGLIKNTSIHAGIRAPVSNPKYDLRHDKACGFHIVRARDLDKLGTQGIIDILKDRIDGSNVYISVDIDVLDPAFAPATGTAEVGGWTTRELLTILDGLSGLEVVGADVVEVAPIYDNPGETTVLAAADVVLSLLTLMVDMPVKSAVLN